MSNRAKQTILLGLGFVVSLAVLEVIFHFYSPFGFRVVGSKISLDKNTTFKTDGPFGKVVHTKNSLGFRGEAWPNDPNQRYKIFTVGGSTTECFYINDGNTWSDHLARSLKPVIPNVWLNNAGIDGHSSFGHLILLKDYIAKLNPQMILYLVGVNDVGRDDLNIYDKQVSSPLRTWQRPLNWLRKAADYSRTADVVLNLYRAYRAVGVKYREERCHLVNGQCEVREIAPQKQQEVLAIHRILHVGYEQRLEALVTTTKQLGATPVLITQPALFFCGPDAETGKNLANIVYASSYNGCTDWMILDSYNEVMRRVAANKNVTLVDLAAKMPHTERYYTDPIHYSAAGAEVVAKIISEQLLEEKNLFQQPRYSEVKILRR